MSPENRPVKPLGVYALLLMLLSPALQAQTKSLLIEDMTWTEVRDAIAAGKTTAIYYAGSIEQNGPGMALGKHVFIAHFDLHAGTDDASELEYVDKMVNGTSAKWIRAGKLVNGHDGDGSGVDGDQTKATVALGKMFTDAKVSLAVSQIRGLIAAGR